MQETIPRLFWNEIGRWYPRSQFANQQQNAVMAFRLTPPSILNGTRFKPPKLQFNRSSPSISWYKILKLIQMLEHHKNRHIQRKFGKWCLDKKLRDDLRSGTRCEGIPNGKWVVKGRVHRRAIRMRWFLMDKRSARCLGLEGGHSRRLAVSQSHRDANEATKNSANFLTQYHHHWWFGCFFKDRCICIKQLAWRKVLLGISNLFFCRSFWRFYKKLPLPFWRVAEYFEGNVKG